MEAACATISVTNRLTKSPAGPSSVPGATAKGMCATPPAQRISTVTFFDDGTYRWDSRDEARPPAIHRGFFRIVGRDQISLTDVGVTAAEPITPATATYTAHVVADQLMLQNAQQTLIFIRAAQ